MNSDGIPLKNIENVEKISEQLVKYVKVESELTSLLLLGYVQSGKTNGMIMTLAKLIETGYRYYVILTGNDNDLYDQTYTRIECTNLGVRMIDKSQIGRVRESSTMPFAGMLGVKGERLVKRKK